MKALYATSLSLVSLLVLVRIIFRNMMPAWRAWRKRKNENTSVLAAQQFFSR